MLYAFQRLTADLLNDHLPDEDWTDYGSPSTIWTGSGGTQPVIGLGTVTARYTMIAAKTCTFRIRINPGSNTTYGTSPATYSFLLPFDTADEQTASAVFRDNSAAAQFSASAWILSGRNIHSVATSAGTLWGPTVPATWASGDRAIITGTYEIA